MFSSRHYTGTVKVFGLTQEFTTPYTPEQNALIERFFRSLKEKCIWQHRFESLDRRRFYDPNEARLEVFQFIEG